MWPENPEFPNILMNVQTIKSQDQVYVEFPQIVSQYPEIFSDIGHCTDLYCAEYLYPSEYKDNF